MIYYAPPRRALGPADPEDVEGAAFEPEPEPASVPPAPARLREPVPEAVPG